ncbi:MAG: nucleotide exchange factor GrpE [Alphaproteobacteria bacterium]|nr:nucleotide exchange factor GrpE [Alphaproteobacteria bacterium]
MSDQDRQSEDVAEPGAEAVVSKPYVMPDDPEPGSAEALAVELAEARDKTLRALAEMENLRKRTAREVSDARLYGVTGFARDVLELADNLRRALDAVPAEARAAADQGLVALIEGVELTERALHNVLEKYGVKKFDPKGEKFDPNFQQAMFEIPDPTAVPGTVVQVIQTGYMIGERVLRAAMVGIAKAVPKPATEGNGAEAAEKPGEAGEGDSAS